MLSIGGSLTPIKAVLGSICIYYMSIFKCPEYVLKELESIRASFFWGGNRDKRKMAWIKWEYILASFHKGGLETGSLKAFNLALLQKWRWRFVHNTDSLWVCVLKAIHGDEAGFNLKGCNNNGFWSSIISSYSNLHTPDIIPIYSLCRKVGDDNDSLSVEVTRPHIDNYLLPSLSPSSRWSKLIPHR
nr:RNA-directed DNA polymerase, eukaryota, reverse transcriptase zinc-binding domain protein [Tanacetum cinerariifolium]